MDRHNLTTNTTTSASPGHRRKALPGKTEPQNWQLIDRWSRNPQSFSRFRPGQPVFVQGAGWSKATVEAVEAGRILIRGRRAGSTAESTFSCFDARNILERRVLSAKAIREAERGAGGGLMGRNARRRQERRDSDEFLSIPLPELLFRVERGLAEERVYVSETALLVPDGSGADIHAIAEARTRAKELLEGHEQIARLFLRYAHLQRTRHAGGDG